MLYAGGAYIQWIICGHRITITIRAVLTHIRKTRRDPFSPTSQPRTTPGTEVHQHAVLPTPGPSVQHQQATGTTTQTGARLGDVIGSYDMTHAKIWPHRGFRRWPGEVRVAEHLLQ